MDMKINKEMLRRERELRAWTQSHLAEVADLSMRTVQRIERTGDASMESAGALAAALNIDLAALMEVPFTNNEITPPKSHAYKLWSAIGVISAVLVAAGWWSNAAAEQVMVSLSIETSDHVYSDMMLLGETGKESEMTLGNQFRMLFSTNRQGEHLFINARIYHFVEDEYQLVSSPAMLVGDQQAASIHVTLPDGQRVNLQLVADF